MKGLRPRRAYGPEGVINYEYIFNIASSNGCISHLGYWRLQFFCFK